MYTTHYALTDDERTSFDLVMGNTETAWDDLSARRQNSVMDLVNKYPDIEKSAVWAGSDSAGSTRHTSPGYPTPGPNPSSSRAMTQKRAWLLQQHEASRQRFTAALHTAVDAEGDMTKYKTQLEQLEEGFHDDEEDEGDEEPEGQSLETETTQKPVAQKSNAQKRRERKKRASEGRVTEGE
ncbi:hypothetical protein N0V84_011698 [Fusarium piperis]|uniref:Uncharacterized protein n=1 Tax=Fusarium piperis TaxID=1435070 RepID=A0A9W8TBG2_9HYPO|nr:hypothetical protein N0V84_011698 [Fusarium piperis]